MPFASVNGVNLHYRIFGTGRPIVFAHGSGGNHISWWQQIPFFSKHYSCIVFDHRSFGFTTAEITSESRRAFADDLKGLLDHLKLPEVAIVAHSMGGRTAVGFTTRNPGRVRSLVLCGSNGGAVTDESREVRTRQEEENRKLPRARIKGLSTDFVQREPEKTFLYRQLLQMNPQHPPEFLAPTPGHRGSTHERLTESGVPILYVVGEHDILAPPRTIEIAASLVPQARMINVPDAGHSVYYERPDVFNRLVMDFLSETYPPKQAD